MFHHRAKGEQGFTLIELLMAITVGGILLGALATGFIAGMRGTKGAHDRFVASNGSQTLATYFLGDAQSANPNWVTTAAVDTGCATTPAGSTNVIRMQWTELTAATRTAYSVSYRTVQNPVGTGDWQLVRYSCSASQSATAPGTTAADVLGTASPAPAVTAHVVATTMSLPVTTTAGSTAITIASGNGKFTAADAGLGIARLDAIVPGTTIASVTNGSQAQLSQNATAGATGPALLDQYKPVATINDLLITLKYYAPLGEGQTTPTLTSVSGTMRTPVTHTFGFTGVPASQAAGSAIPSMTVTVMKNGVTDTGFRGTVRFTSSDIQAGLPADYKFTAADNGAHGFANAVTLKTVGAQTITVTDLGQSTSTGTVSVTVVPGALASFDLTAPATSPSGVPFSVSVTAKDGYGNIKTDFTGAVHFTGGGAGATLPADYSFTAGDGGAHPYPNGVTLTATGNQSIQVTNSGKTGTAIVNVTAAPSTSFKVTTTPSPFTATAGMPFTVQVIAQDSAGNPLTGYTGKVHFTSTDGQVSAGSGLPADYTFVAGDGGQKTFSVTLKTAGGQGVSLYDVASTSVTGTTTGTVSPAGIASFAVTAPPSPTAGSAFDLTVAAKDSFNNTVTGWIGAVTLSSSDSQVSFLPSNSYTFTAGDKGVHTFSGGVTLKTAGAQTVSATSGNGASAKTGQVSVTVLGGAPAKLAFTSCSVAGKATACSSTADLSKGTMTGYISVYDAYGNTPTFPSGWSLNVTVQSSDSGFTVTGSPVSINSSSGNNSTSFSVSYTGSAKSATSTLTASGSGVSTTTMSVKK